MVDHPRILCRIFFIIMEHYTRVDKATVALLTGIVCWVLQYMHSPPDCKESLTCLGEHLANISQIVFFLLGALAIVEIISIHKGFAVIADSIRVPLKKTAAVDHGIHRIFPVECSR